MASPPPRIACLLAPDLPLAAELRADPELRGRPVAVVSGPGPRDEVLAVSPEARRAGVRPWTKRVHAEAVCSALVARVASPALEQAARDALLDAALSASPRAEPAPPGAGSFAAEAAVFVDARGIGALFGSERGFAGALVLRARRLGLPTVASVASTRGVARIAARQAALCAARSEAARPQAAQRGEAERSRNAKPSEGEEIVLLSPGSEAAFLAPLALDLLDPDDELADRLGRLGVRRIGDLLRIPERALVSRFGRRIQPLLALARGIDPMPPPSAPDRMRFEEAVDLEVPVERLEPLLFVLRGALARLAERLACRGLAAGDLELVLALEGGGRDARRIGLAAPTLELRVWLRLVGLSLETHPPAAAIEGLRIASEGRSVRGDQLDFFRPAGPPPATLTRLLAELASLCGSERVGAPALADEHRPDAWALAEFRPRPTKRDAKGAEPVLALRAIRPPLSAQVHAPRGIPERLRSALANGAVLHCAGPWRTTGRWWSQGERYAFDHFDVQTEDGLAVRLRLDLVARRWQIDGVYD